ncbi:MAG TPA: EF-P lysine aminoacylase EpmA [Gammaproteobacteria bacterium]
MNHWRPSAPLDNLKLRAELLTKLRAFFAARNILEVDTPALSRAGATDRHIHSYRVENPHGAPLYLHTSPEFPMKRLLAAGYGDIYQICKVFRSGEAGRMHNAEFTMLEWYRIGFDHHRLMAEVADLFAALVQELEPPEFLTYAEAFQRHAGIDVFKSGSKECIAALNRAGRRVPAEDELDHDGWLDMVAGDLVYPALGKGRLTFIYNYPASQAALARIWPGEPPVAERFEAFIDGVELVNGFHELADAKEQRGRFQADRTYRGQHGLMDVPYDEHLLSALGQGLPDCAGVALGFDRLVMVAARARSLEEVLAFPADRA